MANPINAGTIKYGNKTLTFKVDGEIDSQITSGLLPNSSNAQIIIGNTTTRDSIILFSTDNNGMDCIWKLDNVLRAQYDLELLYVRNLGFSTANPIQAIFNYENENIQKVYWVDGKHQIRFINLNHSGVEGNDALIDLASTSIDFVSVVDFSQPTIIGESKGGIHTAGRVQYAYNLFKLNSSQTKLSPFSSLYSLDKGSNLGGGALNEVVGITPIVSIEDIDLTYDYIRVYAIKYTSYDEVPSISLIDEREIGTDNSLTFYDDGTIISTLSIEEFLLLGSNPVIPRHIESKDNRLILANIQSKEFILPEELDFRAYSFNLNSTTTNIYDSVELDTATNAPIGNKLVVNSDYQVYSKHDAINLFYDTAKYKYNSSTYGATGKFLDLEIVQKTLSNPEDYTVLKDREIYRFGIELVNRLGQKSLPLWICDYKMPTGNLEGNYNTLQVNLTAAFTTWLSTYNFESLDDVPVGYNILRANRTVNDRTIMCQGVISGMMVNSPRDSAGALLYTTLEKRADSEVQVKLPNFLLRTFEDIDPLKANSHLRDMQVNVGDAGDTKNYFTEIQYKKNERYADTYQYNAMYQLYSPEIMFDFVSTNLSTKARVIGGVVNNYNAWWGQERLIASKAPDQEGKTYNKLTPHASGGTNITIKGNITKMQERGLLCNVDGSTPDIKVGHNQFYREFNSFIPSTTIRDYNIYGSPEITNRGQGRTVYNNNAKYTYSNTLEGFLSDGEDKYGDKGTIGRAVLSVNSYGAKCYTFVLDRGDNVDVNPHERTLIENLYTNSGLADASSLLVTELVKPSNDIYFGGIYNGVTYEDKKRTSYLAIGAYSDIGNTTTQIDNAGDTYVHDFKFMRIGKTDVETYSAGVNQHTEIVSVLVETSVDLKNRNDISISDWDARFQPQYTEFHEYNRVYSQQPTLLTSSDLESTFRRVDNFDTRIQSTKLKIPNETIDNWTDLLDNEIMDLNGKFGPINSIKAHKDEIYAFQDEAIALIKINPRVQIQGDDGVGIELGTGAVLYDFNYITTKSGSINKWGIIDGKKGIYYYDALNKGVGRVPDNIHVSLSDVKGLHTYFNNNYDYELLKVDNPILSQGAVFGKDNYNGDIYFTFLQDSKSFTRCFNELRDEFIDLKIYKPTMYINKGERLISVPSNATDTLYEHNKGIFNHYYGNYYPSYIILQVNPESDISCVFDSVFFNSELYLDDIDQSDKTLTSIQAWNEYQNSGKIPLVIGRDKNLRRKFREWKAEIPRDGRNRIRNPWIYLKLELDNESNYKLILHDIIVSYTS